MKKNSQCCADRLNKVGGEAVIEGIMMKAGDRCSTACRDENGEIKIYERSFVSLKKKCKFFNIPILRGVVSFIESMILSFSIMSVSANVMGGEELKKEGKTEKWMKKHLGVGFFDIIMAIAMILGVGLALFLFLYLPSKIPEWVAPLFNLKLSSAALAAVEGGIKILIFVLYMFLVSLMPDIRRVFQYHGAEHKTIACFESGAELTPEEAKQYTRFHPRCGTSFMFVMILLGVILGFVIHLCFPGFKGWLYALTRLLLLPLVMGIGYEFIMFAGKHPNPVTNALSFPGLLMQRITTREPDEQQLEIAITALKFALREEFPDFDFDAYEKIDAKGNIIKEENGEAAAEEKEDTAETAEENPENTDKNTENNNENI